MPHQLTLSVGLDDFARFESFFGGENLEAVAALEGICAGSGQQMGWIWGEPGSGRSHLLQACVARAQEKNRRPIYLPLAEGELKPEALEDLQGTDLICLDDVDIVASQPAWELALFKVYEGARSSGASMVLAAAGSPQSVSFDLPDLASRMRAAAVYRLKSLDDEGRIEALKLRARVRGLDLPADTARYLLSRASRDTASLFQFLDRLDHASLSAGRRLTVPFVREQLQQQKSSQPFQA